MEVDRTKQEQDRLAEVATQLEALLCGGPHGLPGVLELRSTFADTLARILGASEGLDSRAVLPGLTNAPSTRAQAHEELQGLQWDWEQCLASWDAQSAAEDWEIFAEHAAALLARFRRCIGHEAPLRSHRLAA